MVSETNGGENIIVGSMNQSKCGQSNPPVAVASSQVRPYDSGAPRKKSEVSPRRRSSRDTNAIRLSGVGRTAHTFYRRMRTLFFSDSTQYEYQSLFLNGSRRRRKCRNRIADSWRDEDATASAAAAADGTEDLCNNAQDPNQVRVERATKPDEPAIYVIDNFLTTSELEYFDQKIASISFERSFVDNMGYDDDENDDGEDNGKEGVNSETAPHEKVQNDETQNDTTAETTKTQSLSSVSNDDTSKIKSNQMIAIDATKKKKKSKKRKRRTILDDSHRTSTFFSFRKLHDSKISALEQRIADILGCWVHQIEALQLVRYLPGQFFGIHHDLGNLLDDDSVELPRKELTCKRRLVTIFCYLNTLGNDEGGCTYFPKCDNLRVKPERGRAVLWCNITSEGKPDSRTIHAGEVVKPKVAQDPSGTSCSTKKNTNSTECSQPAASGKKTIIKPKSKSSSTGTTETKKYGLNIWICEE